MVFVLNISVHVILYGGEYLRLNAFFFPPQKKIRCDIQQIRHTEDVSETCAQPTEKTAAARVNPSEQNGHNSLETECLAKFNMRDC